MVAAAEGLILSDAGEYILLGDTERTRSAEAAVSSEAAAHMLCLAPQRHKEPQERGIPFCLPWFSPSAMSQALRSRKEEGGLVWDNPDTFHCMLLERQLRRGIFGQLLLHRWFTEEVSGHCPWYKCVLVFQCTSKQPACVAWARVFTGSRIGNQWCLWPAKEWGTEGWPPSLIFLFQIQLQVKLSLKNSLSQKCYFPLEGKTDVCFGF